MFVYDGIKLLEQNAYQTVWLVDFLAFDDRLSAINPITGVSAELATMINKHIDPGQKIAVEKEVFSKRDLVKLRKDAPKYEDKILKRPLLIIYDEINSARDARYTVVCMLSRLLNQAERAAGQSKRQITTLKFVNRNQLFITGSADKIGEAAGTTMAERREGETAGVTSSLISLTSTTLFVFGEGASMETIAVYTLKDHTDEPRFPFKIYQVVAVTVDASEKYFVTASKDNSWCFYDILTGSCLSKVGKASEQEGYTSASFDPHGTFLGTGTTTAVVKIWDVRTQSSVGKLEGHVGPVTAMSFSENGYLLAVYCCSHIDFYFGHFTMFLQTAALDGVQLWDFQKLRNLRTISPCDSDTPTTAVEFDLSGSYLGIGGSDTRVYQVDRDIWNPIKTLPDLSGTGKVTSLKFGAEAKYIAVGSMDHNLRIFGLPRCEQMDD
ncbi:hypothetical protein PR202_gb17423 [Eleusine coracana subsp. coracana]|uniref:Pre-mRNA-processing factor 19 n=1 Tax=Eleusine coracana subsp. coracana TaxID=191504 RepID=A0AAV5F2X1_ELECO|nr:hypothetical protein PR202_gb17423 [Eleusine coracana subsp. coracana]